MRAIRIYGRLAKFLKRRVFHAEVGSAAEAVRFLVTNFPQVEKHMMDQYYRVSVDDYDLDENELHHPVGNDIKITPVVTGAGNVGRIILGALLIIGSFFIPGSAALFGVAIKGVVANIGVALFLGGVAGLLTPVPKTPSDNQDPRKSFSFSGIQQTSRQGTPVPICYGEIIAGSVVISAGVDTVQVAV